MFAVVQRAQRIARSDASVLVRGESGTGKEVIARYIHRNSPRAGGPFVAVNCAAIPEQLLESELFGHERGAFSGALGQRIGKLEAAQNGTILLDEISEMDRRLQAKLLRALQEREIDRIGGRAPIRLNVRIIATTNKDLEQEVVRQNFREDLYFRLNVVAIHIPSLRDRPNDIPALAEHFIEKYRWESGRSSRQLSAAALNALMAHDWPGNVRELENTIHRALVLTTDGVIGAKALEVGPPAGGVRRQWKPVTPCRVSSAGRCIWWSATSSSARSGLPAATAPGPRPCSVSRSAPCVTRSAFIRRRGSRCPPAPVRRTIRLTSSGNPDVATTSRQRPRAQ